MQCSDFFSPLHNSVLFSKRAGSGSALKFIIKLHYNAVEFYAGSNGSHEA